MAINEFVMLIIIKVFLQYDNTTQFEHTFLYSLETKFVSYQFFKLTLCDGAIGCKYVDRSRWDCFTKGLWVFFNHFLLFHINKFLNEIFCTFLLKINIVALIDYMFCVNSCLINMNFSKCVNFIRLCLSSRNFIIILNHTKIC
jgi:hypothetical protein